MASTMVWSGSAFRQHTDREDAAMLYSQYRAYT